VVHFVNAVLPLNFSVNNVLTIKGKLTLAQKKIPLTLANMQQLLSESGVWILISSSFCGIYEKMKKWMKFAAKNCHFCEIKRLKKNEKMKNEKEDF
jgi:hypothetical protein